MISKRIQRTSEPPLVELGKLAAQTDGCISLGQGAPFYAPNLDFVEKHFLQRFDPVYNRYTMDPGIDELRDAISKKLKTDNNISMDRERIVITPGANPAFTNILLSITDPGDKVVLLSPYYFNHEMSCTLANVNMIEVPLNEDFSINEDLLGKTAKEHDIKAIVLVNPGNPTGAVHSAKDLKIIGDIIDGNDIWLITDETYEYFTYNSQHISASTVKTLQDKTITVQSFSKTYGIPGWRLGYYFGPEEIIEQSIKVQDTTVICAPAPAQHFGLQLLAHRNELIPGFKNYLGNNHKMAMDLIEEVSWLENRPSNGAYYLFPRQNTGTSSLKLSSKLILEDKVHIVHGEAFGKAGEDHFRISYANVTEDNLIEAFSRLKKAAF